MNLKFEKKKVSLYCINSQSSQMSPLANLEGLSSSVCLSIFLTGLWFGLPGVSFLSVILLRHF